MDYYSDSNDLPQDPVFTVDFECKNCGTEFQRKFDANAEVHPAGSNSPRFIGIDSVSGNRYVVEIEREEYTVDCDTCDIDTSLYELDRNPLNDH